MRRRAVPRWEVLTRNNEGRHVGPEIAEKIRQAVEHDKRHSITPLMGVRGRARIDTSYQKHSR